MRVQNFYIPFNLNKPRDSRHYLAIVLISKSQNHWLQEISFFAPKLETGQVGPQTFFWLNLPLLPTNKFENKFISNKRTFMHIDIRSFNYLSWLGVWLDWRPFKVNTGSTSCAISWKHWRRVASTKDEELWVLVWKHNSMFRSYYYLKCIKTPNISSETFLERIPFPLVEYQGQWKPKLHLGAKKQMNRSRHICLNLCIIVTIDCVYHNFIFSFSIVGL